MDDRSRPGVVERDIEEAVPTGQERVRARWIRPVSVAAVGALVLAVMAFLVTRGDHAPPPSDPTLDAWAPYWAVDDAAAEFATHAGLFRQISPFWFSATTIDLVAIDEFVPADSSARLIDAARQNGVQIVPSVRDAMPAGAMAAILAEPASRRRHVDTLVRFAAEGDFDGVDLDYEQFAFADDRSTWATTSTAWIAFLGELATRLHDDGRTLTVSVPPVYDRGRTDDSGYWVYDYAAMAPIVDHIRVMAYDYSTATPGAIAPVEWVKRAIDGTVSATGTPEKLVLGVPLYGYNWVTSTAGTCPPDAEPGRTTVTQRALADLLAKRSAVPVHDVVSDEWTFAYALDLTDGANSCTQQRAVRYVDQSGALARIELARAARFGGVSLWALGYEAPGFWSSLIPVNPGSGEIRPVPAGT